MGKNMIFVFTGTGNSLWTAREIAGELGNCTIISMGSRTSGTRFIDGSYDTVGFVYPTYYRGMPAQVRKFISCLDFKENTNAYFYGVATCGNVARSGNSIIQLYELLKQKGVILDYGKKLGMYSNYVVMYDMDKDGGKMAAQSAEDIKPIIGGIKNREKMQDFGRWLFIEQLGYRLFMHFAPGLDQSFRVSEECIRCGICKKVCPVENIDYNQEGRPLYRRHCEQCLACLHLCPVKAINYKDKTADRGRYVHPQITWRDLAELNHWDMEQK